jgi:hypothetical protein
MALMPSSFQYGLEAVVAKYHDGSVKDGVSGLTERTGRKPGVVDLEKSQPALAPETKLLLPHSVAIVVSLPKGIYASFLTLAI